MWDEEYNRSHSCDVGLSQKAEPESKAYPDGTAIIHFNEGGEVPYEKILEMRAYARKLGTNSGKMKLHRINRKLEEKFKITLT